MSQDIVFKEVVGLQKWRCIKDPLDVVSGLITIGLYALIGCLDCDILRVLGGSTAASMLLASVWLFIFLKDKIRIDLIIGCE